MIKIENKDRSNHRLLGKMPTIDAELFLVGAKNNDLAGYFEAELDVENYRHARVWMVSESSEAMAFYAGWKWAKSS